jgi:hypothetical protein
MNEVLCARAYLLVLARESCAERGPESLEPEIGETCLLLPRTSDDGRKADLTRAA